MLARLLKYEIKATSRVFLPLYAALLIFSGINKLFMLFNNKNAVMNLLSVLVMIAFVMIVIIIFVLTLVVMIQRFYKNLLGDEGYLMFTLPVSTWMNVAAKLITSILWVVLSLISTMLAIGIMTADQDSARLMAEGFHQAAAYLSQYGWNIYALIAEMIVYSLIGLVTAILMIYTSISIGHLFGRHKILASFGAFLALNFAFQVVSSAVIFAVSSVDPGLLSSGAVSREAPYVILTLSFALLLVYGVACFIGTNYILSKHLNLE